MGGGGTGPRKNEELIGDWLRFRQTLTRRGFRQKYPSSNSDLLHFIKRQVVLAPAPEIKNFGTRRTDGLHSEYLANLMRSSA